MRTPDDDTNVVPLRPQSNQDFLEMLFGPRWREVLVTSFTRDPADPTEPRQDWTGWPAGQVLHNRHFTEGNTYFCPSLLVPGCRDRRIENFASLWVITVDDIGTKVDRGRLLEVFGRGPNYMLESSPGNFQAGWRIEEVGDLAWVKGLLTALDRALEGKADNLTNPIAWRRLPQGRNTKAALRTRWPGGWPVRLREVRPERIIRGLDWLEAEAQIGEITRMTTVDRGIGNGQRPDDAALKADPIYQALAEGGRILGAKLTSDRFWAVTIRCPWIKGHGPTRPETGAEYVPAVAGQRGWFHCFHCERRTQAEFREQLDIALREEGAKPVGWFEFDEIDAERIPPVDTAGEQALVSYEGTEDGLALAFAAEHEGRLRFDHARKRWFRWTGDYWRMDEVQHAFRWARELARRFRATQETGAKSLARVAVAGAIERAAQVDVRLAVDGLGWDQDLFLISAPGCEIDLWSGARIPPDPKHGITKQVRVAPADMPTPLWDRFLWESTGGDTETIGFLQALAGYCLTGDTSEEKFVFLYGPGGNGKGTFLHTLGAILHDYAVRTAAETFMVRKGYEAHPTEIASLAGARLVIAAEIEEGRTFNSARLKDLTGRDGKVKTRFMRQDEFEFTPQFKLIFVGNNQPRLTQVDDAMRRRTILIPFSEKPKVPDTSLKDRLVAEYPGILSWMIQGELRRIAGGGLSALTPSAAAAATNIYLEEQDTLKAWAEERCTFCDDGVLGATAGLEDYRLWCHEQGKMVDLTRQHFSLKFVEKFAACRKAIRQHKHVILGVKLLIDI